MVNKLHLKQREERKNIIKDGYLFCKICKEKKLLIDFPKDKRTGRYSSRCNKCRYKQSGVKYYGKTKDTPKRKYDIYKNMAKSRGYIFNLSLDEFMTFWEKNCSYCGDVIETIGVDRVNNSIGYEVNNCVPCCELCNKMKRTLSVNEFMNHCQKIIDYQTVCAGSN